MAEFFNLKRFHPRFYRVSAAVAWFIPRRAILEVPFRRRGGAWLAAWCSQNFERELALKHYLRIARRIGRADMMLQGEFHFAEKSVRPLMPTWIGAIITRKIP